MPISSIVEFPSYEEAMANSDRLETEALAATLQKLCDAPPVFTDLDVRREENWVDRWWTA